MESSAAFETHNLLERPEAVAESDPIAQSATITRPARALSGHQILRCGGLALDTLTEATSWRGKTLALPAADRELLGVFMRHAGQIISRRSLAATLGITPEELDRRVQALWVALKRAGSTCLPYTVEGLGYAMWR